MCNVHIIALLCTLQWHLPACLAIRKPSFGNKQPCEADCTETRAHKQTSGHGIVCLSSYADCGLRYRAMFKLQYLLTAQVVPRTFDLAGMLAVQSPALTAQKK